MPINSTSNSALQGINQGFRNMRRIASDVAGNIKSPDKASSSTDLSRSLVEMKQVTYQTKASVKIVQAENEMIGSLLDVKA